MKNPPFHIGLQLFAILSLLIFCTSSCLGQKEKPIKKKKDLSTEAGTSIISAPVVSKSFVKKNGVVTDKKELYLQRSIQDYYIKFCESKITQEALEHHLSNISGFIKSVSLEVEFREGAWDICDGNMDQQSRIGAYVIIHRIIGG